jgi:drug/metabolite transporter (DMT)-like permease
VLQLLAASLVWAFSFGLIGHRLAGLDPCFVAAVRLLVSLVVLLPLLRPSLGPRALRLRLVGVGSVQYGLMYLCYVAAFRWLDSHEVALFTVLTPIFVAMIDDLFERRVRSRNLASAAIAVAGAAVVSYSRVRPAGWLAGAMLVQASNVSFAVGQVLYRRWLPTGARDRDVFAWLYLGGFAVSALAAAALTDWRALAPSGSQLLVLLYLGAVPSGLGFFLWNHGARRVEVGTLAVFNDLKIPLAVAVSLLCFSEQARVLNLVVGGALVVGALLLSRRGRGGQSVPD